ncbi:uncharacterized protein LOC127741530 [Arachis duranensis]|uniref:Uncharacterized protein LOC127741530 n=1 Tax=Arachis duranensis TaxID=130453 RepID=A0A9C6TKX0_ARADU|nr:uncharacterized protein LOC127741530 [Arachis duranensis]
MPKLHVFLSWIAILIFASWCFSTGDELVVQWDSSLSVSGLCFSLRNQTSTDSSVKLLKGRQRQYQVKRKRKADNKSEETKNNLKEDFDEEEGFITLVRLTGDDPDGRATALLNWKLLVVEVLPEEDAVLMLLLCISILKSVSEMMKQDVGGLLVRRRLKETRVGTRDWGSVMLHPSSSSSSDSRYLQPWYWNAWSVMIAPDAADQVKRMPASTQSLVEGSDKLYKHGIIS